MHSLFSWLSSRFRSRLELELEVIALRHQLAVLRRQRPGRTRLFSIDRVCGEFQFMRQLGSEISRCSVAASDMTEGLRLEEEVRRCIEQA